MSTTDELIKNYSGLLGNLVVVKSRKGKSFITMPVAKVKKAPTEGQITVRQNFIKAARYAKKALLNPDMLAAYTARARQGLPPYIVAMTDFLKPPFVDQVDVSGYAGNPGDKIIVTAGDDFEISSVMVQIFGADDVMIEQGACTLDPISGNYDFTATVELPDLTDVTIVAKATDFPAHSGQMTVTL